MESDNNTPIRKTKSLSTEAEKFCISCTKIPAESKDKVRLLDGQKFVTDKGLLFERLVDVKLSILDFPFICQNCWRKITRVFDKLEEIKVAVTERRDVSKTYVEVTTKRLRKSS